MTWFRIGFDDAISHAVHESLRGHLVDDMARRNHPIKDFATAYSPEFALSLGGNPKEITSWRFDLGGSVHLQRPDHFMAAWREEASPTTAAGILMAVQRAAHESTWTTKWSTSELEESASRLLYQPVWVLDEVQA